jgi:hypothetical protein
MKLWLVCYANRRYAAAQRYLVRSAKRFGFDQIYAFNKRQLRQTDFFRQHRAILSAPCGGGYWLWKPFYIAQVLQMAAPGDVVVYNDSGSEFIADPRPLIDICRRESVPMLFQTHNHLNLNWTKRDCLVGMGCDLPRFHFAQQLLGACQLYPRNEAGLEFVNSWLNYCCQPKLLTDAPNICGLPNYPEFVKHRHDQSILSLLAEKWRLPIYRDPSQWGNPWALPEFRPPNVVEIDAAVPYENSPYGQLLDLHRRGKGPKRKGILAVVRALEGLRNVLPLPKAA